MEILVFSRNIDIPTVLLKALCRHPLKRNYASLFFFFTLAILLNLLSFSVFDANGLNIQFS